MSKLNRVEIEVCVSNWIDVFPSWVWRTGSILIIMSWIVYYFTC